MKTLVLGLGNEIIADDAVGVIAARQLQSQLVGRADVMSCALHGLALLELFIDYDRAILIDAIQTGKIAPGTIIEIQPDELPPVQGPSPHFAGIPEMLDLARKLQVKFPSEFRIFAMEVADMQTIGGPITPAVAAAIPELCRKVSEAVEGRHTNGS